LCSKIKIPHGLVHVLALDGRREAHLGVGLGETDERLELTRSGRDRVTSTAALSELRIGVDEVAGRCVAQFWVHLLAGVRDVGGQGFLVLFFLCVCVCLAILFRKRTHQNSLIDGCPPCLALVHADDVASKERVVPLVGFVEDEVDQIESNL